MPTPGAVRNETIARSLIIGSSSVRHRVRAHLLAAGIPTSIVDEPEGGLRQVAVRGYDAVLFVGNVAASVVAHIEALRGIAPEAVIVVLLEANDAAGAAAAAVRAGADDAIPKEVAPEELVARLRAIHSRRLDTRRARHGEDPASSLYGTVEAPAKSLRVEDEDIRLTRSEALLLQALGRNPGSVVERGELALHVFGDEQSPSRRGVDVHVCRIRKKLRHLAGGAVDIRTVPRVGYVLEDRRVAQPGSRRV